MNLYKVKYIYADVILADSEEEAFNEAYSMIRDCIGEDIEIEEITDEIKEDGD